jgi:hypothetical protein
MGNTLASASSLAAGAKQILQDGVVGLVASSYSAIKERFKCIKEQSKAGDKPAGLIDFAKRFMEGGKTDPNDPKTKGENDAAIIVKLIAENIFKGKCREHFPQSIVENVKQEYEIIEQDLSKLNLDQKIAVEKSEINNQNVSPKSTDNKYHETISHSSSIAEKKIICNETFNLLEQDHANSIGIQLTMERFKAKTFDFEVSKDIIIELADFYLGIGRHKIVRDGKWTFTSFVFGKINLNKELKAGFSSAPKEVSGEMIYNVLVKCKLVDKVDLSKLNKMFETEEYFRFAKPFSSEIDNNT